MLPLVIVEGVVIVLLSVLVAGLLRSHAEILRRLHALGAGDQTPASPVPLTAKPRRQSQMAPVTSISGPTPDQTNATISLAGGRGATLLAFLSSGCASCRTFWDAFGEGIELPGDQTRLVIVTKGPESESPATIARLAPKTYTTIMSTESWDAFKVPMTPHFVLVDGADGRVLGEGAAGTWEHVTDLLLRSIDDSRALRRTTAERLRDTDEELARADIHPGDPSLYRNPASDR